MVIDIVLVISALYGFYLGFSKGIIGTVLSVFSIIFGVLAAFKFAPKVTEVLQTTLDKQTPLMFIAGFVLTFVVVMLVIRMIAKGMEGILKSARINVINQVFGGALLSGLAILVFSIMVWFGDQSHIIDQSTKNESMSYPYLEPFPNIVWGFGKTLKPAFQDFWAHSLDVLDKIEDMSVERTETDPSVYDIPDDNDTRQKAQNTTKPRRRKLPPPQRQ